MGNPMVPCHLGDLGQLGPWRWMFQPSFISFDDTKEGTTPGYLGKEEKWWEQYGFFYGQHRSTTGFGLCGPDFQAGKAIPVPRSRSIGVGCGHRTVRVPFFMGMWTTNGLMTIPFGKRKTPVMALRIPYGGRYGRMTLFVGSNLNRSCLFLAYDTDSAIQKYATYLKIQWSVMCETQCHKPFGDGLYMFIQPISHCWFWGWFMTLAESHSSAVSLFHGGSHWCSLRSTWSAPLVGAIGLINGYQLGWWDKGFLHPIKYNLKMDMCLIPNNTQ